MYFWKSLILLQSFLESFLWDAPRSVSRKNAAKARKNASEKVKRLYEYITALLQKRLTLLINILKLIWSSLFFFLYKSNTLKIKITNLFLLLTFPLRWSSREWSSASYVSSHVLQRVSIKSILNMIGWKVRWLIGAYFSIVMLTLTYILAHPKPPWPIMGPWLY